MNIWSKKIIWMQILLLYIYGLQLLTLCFCMIIVFYTHISRVGTLEIYSWMILTWQEYHWFLGFVNGTGEVNLSAIRFQLPACPPGIHDDSWCLHHTCVFLCLLRFPYKNDVRLVTLISLVILLIALDHEGICLASYPMCTRWV